MRDDLLGHDASDADFLVPGVDIEGLRTALAPHGGAEELVVAGRSVGVRFHPRDPEVRKLVRAGIELAPPLIRSEPPLAVGETPCFCAQ